MLEFDLMRRLSSNDESAVEVVLKQLCPPIWSGLIRKFRGCLQRDEVEDIIFWSLMKLWMKRATLDPEKGSLSGLLTKIAIRRSIDVVRKKLNHAGGFEVLLGAQSERVVDSKSISERHEDDGRTSSVYKDLLSCISKLDEKLKYIIFNYMESGEEDGSSQQVADALGLSASTVRVYWMRVRKKLREDMEDMGYKY
jgi:RNA polymerase sigma factor (sigma-70 family)